MVFAVMFIVYGLALILAGYTPAFMPVVLMLTGMLFALVKTRAEALKTTEAANEQSDEFAVFSFAFNLLRLIGFLAIMLGLGSTAYLRAGIGVVVFCGFLNWYYDGVIADHGGRWKPPTLMETLGLED